MLGPVEATRDGRPIPLGATKQRALLAMLGLHANETVSIDRLVDGLWGEEPPATAPKMVQLYVSQLRRLLAGDDAQIVTHGRGYELRLPADAVDAARFERLIAEAGRPDRVPNGAARAALALWHGAALADVADEPFAPAEIRRLNELWLRAAELAIDGDLAGGRHEEVLAKLERLIEEHPLRERPHAQRMLALYRSGREAEALDAYIAARRRLVDDAGIEPSAELRELHERMLRQDPGLRLVTTPVATGTPENGRAPPGELEQPAPDAGATGAPRRSVRGRYLFLAAAGVVLAALAIFAVTRPTGRELLQGLDENAVGPIDPVAAGFTAQYPVGRDPAALAVGAGSVWVASAGDGTVTRIDPAGDQMVTIPVGDDLAGLAFGEGSLWITDRQGRTVSQIDPARNRVVHQVGTGNAPRGIAAGFGALWVASEVDRTVDRIALARGAARRPIDLGANPTAIAAGAGAVWVTSEESGTVFRIEPRTGEVAKPIGVGNGPVAVAVGEGGVWVANRQDGTVSHIEPATDAVTAVVPVGRSPSAIAVGEGAVWVADSGDGTVVRLDPATRRPAGKIAVGSSPTALAIAAGGVWTAAVASPASHRGGTLRVEMPSRFFGCCIEPATYGPDAFQLLSLTHDGLIAYRRTGGSTYGRLVGDLATDVPEPSPDGRTYVFRLRPGIRFSNGSLVTPEDFRASLEALLRRRDRFLPPYFSSIVGAAACAKTPADCDLSKGISTDANARTITIRLTEPDTELLHKLAFPFAYVAPADHPFRPKAVPPGTGPYRVASFERDSGARLVRNEHFKVWSQDARPDGFADEIDVRLRKDIDAQVTAVRRGDADVMTVSGAFGGPVRTARIRALAARNAGQLHTSAAPTLDFMWLNTRTPPFDDVRVRQAVNFAVDRREALRISGGPDLAQETCQYVPPGFPGYTPSCRYTTNPGRGGSWSGPDLERARRLIARSRTDGMPVTVWTYRESVAIGRYFVSLLDRLGYRSSIRVVKDFESYYSQVADSRTRAQLGILGWVADFGAPSSFTPQFVCSSFVARSPTNGNLTQLCDRRIEARIADANAARGGQADAIWQDVYRRLADAAPAVPLVNRRIVTFVSRRVGNHQHHPMWGTLLDQLWVR